MKRTFRYAAVLALVAVMGMTASQPESGLAQTADPRPNILFILADDLRASDLRYMPNTRNLMADQGTEFTKHG